MTKKSEGDRDIAGRANAGADACPITGEGDLANLSRVHARKTVYPDWVKPGDWIDNYGYRGIVVGVISRREALDNPRHPGVDPVSEFGFSHFQDEDEETKMTVQVPFNS